jgi:outer membrane biosynthesis protein TonB
MLRVLMASQPIRAGWAASTTFSTVTHGALIAIAVVATNQTVSAVHETRAAERLERITDVERARIEDALRRAEAAKRAQVAAERAAAAEQQRRRDLEFAELQSLAALPIDVPDITAQPDLTAVADAWLAQPDGMEGPVTTSMNDLLAKKSGFVRPTNGVYEEYMVERSVQPRRGNPKPRYPGTLADMGIEGAFIVRFVVDSAGEVPADKIEFPSTMHRLFVTAVRTALLKSHYAPAMIAGHVVAQQVIQEFRFEVGRRR